MHDKVFENFCIVLQLRIYTLYQLREEELYNAHPKHYDILNILLQQKTYYIIVSTNLTIIHNPWFKSLIIVHVSLSAELVKSVS